MIWKLALTYIVSSMTGQVLVTTTTVKQPLPTQQACVDKGAQIVATAVKGTAIKFDCMEVK